MEIALVILAVAFLICFSLLIFRPDSKAAPKAAPKDAPAKAEGDKSAAPASQESLELKAAELQKAKGELQKTKDELKHSKQKLFEAREKNKQLEAELKSQKQLERQALLETESAQAQLADLTTELHKLRLELETQKPSSSGAVASSVSASSSKTPSLPPAAVAESAKAASKPAKLVRELSPAEKEKLENVERLIAAEHSRAQEVEKEFKNLKIRFELVQRQLKTTQSSSKLQKDKFRALEKRLNRTLLEKDFILRAMHNLESRCGLQAVIAELPEEDAAEDASAEASENMAELSADSKTTEEMDAMDAPFQDVPLQEEALPS